MRMMASLFLAMPHTAETRDTEEYDGRVTSARIHMTLA